LRESLRGLLSYNRLIVLPLQTIPTRPKKVSRSEVSFEPRTPMGKLLVQWRAQYIEEGGTLLTRADLEREIAARRGERSEKP
jgi:hypothetical protein